MNNNIKNLKSSYEFFRSLVENQIELVVRWLPDGTRIYVNKSYCTNFGLTKEKATGTNYLIDMPKESQGFIKEKINLLSPENQEIIFELRQPLNEKIKWINWSNKGFFDDKGKLKEILSVGRDITERKENQISLKKSEQKYKQSLEDSGLGIGVYDTEGKILLMNKKACEDMQCKPEDLIGKYAKDVFGEYMGNLILERFKKTISSEKTLVYEDEVDMSGRKRWYSSSYSKISESEKNIIGIQIISKEITELKKAKEELLKQKQKAEKYLNTAGTILVSLDLNGNITLLNKKGYKIFEYDEGSLIGKNWFDTCIPKENIHEIKRVFKEIMTGQIEVFESYENDIITKQGKKRKIKWYNTLLKDETGAIIGLLSSGEDITEKKKAEEDLENIFNMSTNLICVADLTTPKFLNVNPGFTKVLGWSEKELLERPFTEFIHPDDVEPTQKVIEEQLLKGKKVLTFQNRYKCKDGSYKWLDWNSHPIAEEKKTYAIARDITEQKINENKIKTSKDRLEKMINSTSELIASVDSKGNITVWNPAIEKKTGCTRKEMINKNINQDVFCKGCEKIIEIMKNALDNKKTGIVEKEITDKQGNPYTVLVNTSFIRDTDYKISGVVLVGHDISDRKIISKLVFPGVSYCLYNKSIEDTIDIFNSFADKSYSLLCVTRDNLTRLNQLLNKKTKIILMSESKYEKIETANNPKIIFEKIKKEFEKNKKTIILLSRLEYISAMHGFNELMNFLYKLNDLTRFSKNIVLVHVDSTTISESELSKIKQEFVLFPQLDQKETITEGGKKLLVFLLDKEISNLNVYSGDIGKEFNLSRNTTKKIIEELQLPGLIKVEKKGRSKLIIITNKGKALLN